MPCTGQVDFRANRYVAVDICVHGKADYIAVAIVDRYNWRETAPVVAGQDHWINARQCEPDACNWDGFTTGAHIAVRRVVDRAARAETFGDKGIKWQEVHFKRPGRAQGLRVSGRRLWQRLRGFYVKKTHVVVCSAKRI